MKKNILMALMLATSPVWLWAQQPGAKSFAGITAGSAFASGNFTKNNYDDNGSGYAASTGFNLGLEGAWYFSRYMGIGGVASLTSFGNKGLQSMAEGYRNAFDVDDVALTVSGRYQLYNFLIGPYFSLPVKKFTFDLRLAAGLVSAGTPGYQVELEDQAAATF